MRTIDIIKKKTNYLERSNQLEKQMGEPLFKYFISACVKSVLYASISSTQ